MTLFEGFDPLQLNENGFELTLDGSPYLSLYHDCKLEGFDYEANQLLRLNLLKVFDSGYGPEMGSKIKIEFQNALISKIESNGEGNFEDVNELILLSQSSQAITIGIAIGAMYATLTASKIILSSGH